MATTADASTQAPRTGYPLYARALLLVVAPLVATLGLLLAQNHRLIVEERGELESRLREANRQARFALDERLGQARQMAGLIAGSREVSAAMAERDNAALYAWGDRMIRAGLASEIYFVSTDGQVLARGHQEFRFGDTYADSLMSGTARDRAPQAAIVRLRGARPAFAARAPVIRYDVQWLGSVVLYREITPELLGALGLHPDIALELAPGAAAEPGAARPAASHVAMASDLPAHGDQRFHLRLSMDVTQQLEKLGRLNFTLWLLSAFALVVLPALTAFALYRLLAPVRQLHGRLARFGAGGADSEALIRDIESLARTRNEVGAIAASVASALKALHSARADLMQSVKLAGLGAMVAGVSHEMNTPIGNSLAAATTLRERARELAAQLAAGQVQRSALTRFLAECDEGSRILESSLTRAAELLRSFKQVAVDQASGRRRDYDLRELAADVLLTLRPTLKRLPLEARLEIAPGLRMEGYPGALAQVLTNLVQNAALHGLDGQAQGEIRIAAEAAGEAAVVLRVSDNGRGIAPEHLERIFEPFFTTRLERGGSGLGLHISRKLVGETLGGTIEVRSEPARGTTFTLTLPRRAPSGETPDEGGTPTAHSGPAGANPQAMLAVRAS